MQIELENLLKSISQESPCGVDVRNLVEESQARKKYQLLRELRNDQRRQERKSIETTESLQIEPKEWVEVVRLSCELLEMYTKDLEIASWLLEGLVRVEAFKGLDLGFRVLGGLLLAYESKLHPIVLEEEDADMRLTSIGMLGGKYELGSLVVPVYYHTVVPTNSGADLNAWTIRQMLGKSEDTRIEFLMDCDAIKSSILDLQKDSFAIIAKDLLHAKASFEEFNSALSKVFSKDAPNTFGLEYALNYCCAIAVSIDGFLTSKMQASLKESEQEGVKITSNFSIAGLTWEHLTRQDAVELVRVIAKFFQVSEPHSPISYTLNRLAQWACLDLPDLLQDIGISENARVEYCKITGVPFLQSRENRRAYDDD
jgi:type VI secretion system protein ImpA